MNPYPSRIQRSSGVKRKKRGILVAAAVAGAAVALIVLLFSFIREVDIVIVPYTREVPVSVEMELSNEKKNGRDSFLQTRVVHAEVSDLVTIDVTTQEDRGSKSRGMVKLINKTGSPYNIVLDTVLRGSNGEEYIPTKETTVPAAFVSTEGDVVYGESLIEVIARNPGERANAASGRMSISSVPVEKGDRIYAEIQSPGIQGGSSEVVRVVGEEELEKGRSILQKKMEIALLKKIQDQLQEGEILPDVLLFREEVVGSDPEKGAEADTVDITYALKAEAYPFMRDKMNSILKQKIQQKEGGISQWKDPDYSSFTFAVLERMEGAVSVRIEGTLQEIPSFDIEQLRQKVLGKTFREARRILLAEENIKDVRFVKNRGFREKVPEDAKKVVISIIP